MLKIWRSLILAILWCILPLKLISHASSSSPNENSSCPQDIKQLTTLLLQDLPNYSNRVIQRTQRTNRQAGIRNFIITASRAEFEPLELPRLQYTQVDNSDPEQVFFTVLERQYRDGRITNNQTFHWMFITPTDNGWRLVMMFSRFGNSQENTPPTPPQETTNGIIGRGVQLWLRDCRAGRIDVLRK